MKEREMLENHILDAGTSYKNNLIALGIPIDKVKLLQFARFREQNATKPTKNLKKKKTFPVSQSIEEESKS